jgi:hypothetical protein
MYSQKPKPGDYGRYLTLQDAQDHVKAWGEAVVAGSPPADIAGFFSEDAILRGTVSAMLRFQNSGKENTFAKATNGNPKENSITQYFEYFNGNNLKDFTTDWDNTEDTSQRLAPNMWLLNLIRKFEYTEGKQEVSVVAVMTFIVKQNECDFGPKIVSLISSPMFPTPPSELNETVTLPPS